MGEALYPWPVLVWFCDHCDSPAGAGEKPGLCPRCLRDSMDGVLAAPQWHWEEAEAMDE